MLCLSTTCVIMMCSGPVQGSFNLAEHKISLSHPVAFLWPISQSLHAYDANLIKLFCCYLKIIDSIRPQVCTCHDSSAVVACGNLRPDWFYKAIITATLIFARFWLFREMLPGVSEWWHVTCVTWGKCHYGPNLKFIIICQWIGIIIVIRLLSWMGYAGPGRYVTLHRPINVHIIPLKFLYQLQSG